MQSVSFETRKKMFASSRKDRQIAAVSVYIVIATVLAALVYFMFFRVPPTCFDNDQNQDEQGIDCGGVCALACKEVVEAEDLELSETVFVPAGNGSYDALIRVHNQNDLAGASSFSYRIDLLDASGNTLVSRVGTSYILPQEKKYVTEMNMDTPEAPVAMKAVLSDVTWENFSGYVEKPTINIYNKSYSQVTDGVGFSKAFGLVSNESPYDFQKIIVRVILRDQSGKILAFNSTEQRTMKSHEERDFTLPWASAFPGVVEKVEMEVDADVYHSDNFTRKYMPGGKFQELAPAKAY